MKIDRQTMILNRRSKAAQRLADNFAYRSRPIPILNRISVAEYMNAVEYNVRFWTLKTVVPV